ncbi:MAG: bifunctional hydroxymethylpyrimidine kinase/phosphomethylpyrimidine kinase [Bacillota bacterium]
MTILGGIDIIKRALTIAGSDSGGGAGIQADIKAFENIGVFGMSVITALTAQNTLGVQGIHQVPAEFVAAQIDSVMTDIGADSVKVGMLGSLGVVKVVADRLRYYRVDRAVIDPVMVAATGALLLQEEAVSAIRDELMPCAYIITPNLYEAEVLTGIKIKEEDDMRESARILCGMGAAGALIKGGHFESQEAVDIFYDGREFHRLSRERVKTKNTHGTGCTLSSAIAAYLCFETDPVRAIELAKEYVYRRIKQAGAGSVGKGYGPVCIPGSQA